MNYIYKITNKTNGKNYIGQTRKTVEQRWTEHISAANSNPSSRDYNFLLHKAIRKYGANNFFVETIEEIENANDLSNREQYWINFYNSCILEENACGYNMTYGGEGSSYINKQEIFEFWESGLGSLEISKLTGHASTSIKNILSTYATYNKEIDFARNTGVPVYCYNNKGQLIAKYPSITFAAKEVGIDPSIINKCCNKTKKSGAGFFWSYLDNESFEEAPLKTWKQLRVLQLSLDGKIIAEYESMSAAGRAMNKKQTKYIKECCEGKRKEMYGFLWKYKEDYVDKLAQGVSAQIGKVKDVI